MPVKWIDYKGKQVLYVDCRKATSKEFIALLREADANCRASPNKVLYLGNIADAGVSREVMQEIKDISDKMARKKLKKLAVVGVKGVKGILMDATAAIVGKSGVPVRSFETDGEALEWLVEEQR